MYVFINHKSILFTLQDEGRDYSDDDMIGPRIRSDEAGAGNNYYNNREGDDSRVRDVNRKHYN